MVERRLWVELWAQVCIQSVVSSDRATRIWVVGSLLPGVKRGMAYGEIVSMYWFPLIVGFCVQQSGRVVK